MEPAASSGERERVHVCVYPPGRSSSLPLVELMAAGITLQALGPLRSRINLLGREKKGTLAVSNKRAEEVSQNTQPNLLIFLPKRHSASRVEYLFIFITKNNILAAVTLAP